MSPESWWRIIRMSVVAAICEVMLGGPCFMAPGWANQWPFGLSINVVWSGGMAILASLILMTLASGLGAVVGLVFSWRGAGLRYGRPVYCAWIICAAIATLFTYVHVYRDLHATTLKMWPNGYPNRKA
jgi:hypothetical protein